MESSSALLNSRNCHIAWLNDIQPICTFFMIVFLIGASYTHYYVCPNESLFAITTYTALFLNDKSLNMKIIRQSGCRMIFPSIKQMSITIILFKEFAHKLSVI